MTYKATRTVNGSRVIHGTVHAYNFYACRCKACRQVVSKYRKALRARARKRNKR